VRAYEQHGTDGAAAHALDLPRATFQSWRWKAGLPPKAPRGHWVRPDDKRYCAAYEETPHDAAAANLLGISTSSFYSWRTHAGLASKRPRGVSVPPAEEKRRRATYAVAVSDPEAARLLGMELGAYKAWRSTAGLPARGYRPRRLDEQEEQRRYKAYAEHTTFEAARELGLHFNTIRDWEKRRGLPFKARRRAMLAIRGPEGLLRLQAYHETGSDAEAAAKLSMTRGGFAGWRNRHGLAPKREMHAKVMHADREERYTAAYHAFATDGQAATALGITRAGFAVWRSRRCLPPARPSGGQWVSAPEERRREGTLARASSDAEAARLVGLKPSTFATWRVRRGHKLGQPLDA